MNLRRKTSLIAAAVLVASLTLAAIMVAPLQRVHDSGSGGDSRDVLYMPSARAIRAMSLGYTGLAADIYWTRAVQYFGQGHREGNAGYPLLAPLLDLATDLDPKMTVAYQYGSIFLVPPPPAGAGEPDKAVALVEKGIRTNPNNWRLYLSLGFIHYQFRHDITAAAAAFERGSQVPAAHPSLKILAAIVTREGGDEQKYAFIWRAIYETTEDKEIKKNAADHLAALRVDSEVTQLEALVKEFQQRTGRTPSNFGEMAASGWLRVIPRDPVNNPYRITPDGRVEVEDRSKLPFITKGLPPGSDVKVGIPLTQ